MAVLPLLLFDSSKLKQPHWMSKRGWNRVQKIGWEAVGWHWHKHFRGKRFRVFHPYPAKRAKGQFAPPITAPASMEARKYGFQQRRDAYVRRKYRKSKYARFNVYTGRTRDSMKFAQVRAYPSRVRVDYALPWYAAMKPNRRAGNEKPWIAQEVLNATEEEMEVLREVWIDAVTQAMRNERGVPATLGPNAVGVATGSELAGQLGII